MRTTGLGRRLLIIPLLEREERAREREKQYKVEEKMIFRKNLIYKFEETVI